MRLSDITLALRQERRERFEQTLKDSDRAEWREYKAERDREIESRRNEVTGY